MAKETKKINKVVEFYAKKWHQKTWGNTYFNVKVYVDDKYIGQSGYKYGYGRQYEEEGFKILKENGYLQDKGIFESTLRYFRENGIEFISHIIDTPRERDLKEFINQKG